MILNTPSSLRFARLRDHFDFALHIGVHLVWIVAGVVLAWASAGLPSATAELVARVDAEYRATLAADRERLRAEFRCSGDVQ